MFFIFFIPAAFLLSAALAHYTDSTLLLSIFGLWLIFFQPGFLAIRIFFGRYFNPVAEKLLAVPVSVALSAVVVLVLFGKFGLPFTFLSVVTVIAALNLIMAAVALYRRVIAFRPGRTVNISWRSITPFIIVSLVFTVVHLINIYLYPYLPEADSYALIQKIREAHQEASVQQFVYRPLFLQFMSAVTLVTSIDPLIFFRWLTPFLLMVVSFFGVQIARESGANRVQQVLAGLTLLSVPVIFQESEYVRSQSPIILFAAVVIWLLISWKRAEDIRIWALAVVMSVIGFAFHEFSIFLLIACVLLQVPFYLKMLRTKTSVTLWWSLAVFVAVYPSLGAMVRGGLVGRIIYDIIYNFKTLHFNPWFIDSYVNSDGNNLGWPGVQAFLYYGYNLGLLVPGLLMYWLLLRQAVSQVQKNVLVVALVFCATPFVFAELLPRFGLAYLPDRAWLYVAFGLSFVTVSLVRFLSKKQTIFFIILAVFSIVVSPLVTYMKQGWITRSEYAGAVWIRDNTDVTSVVYAQVGSIEPLAVYADRLTVDGRPIFDSKGSVHTTNQFVNDNLALLFDERNKAEQELFSGVERGENQKALNARLLDFVTKRRAYRSYIPFKNRVNTAKERYIVYSTDKFMGVYGSRGWWRQLNSEGADITFLENSDQFELVFSEGGTRIWKEK